MNARATAAKILHQVIVEQRSLTKVLQQTLSSDNKIKEASLIQELSYGTLRWYYRLSEISQHLLKSPLKKKDHDIFCLLLVGLYQLNFSKKPNYVVVSETVAASNKLQKSWAKGLLNKTLRRFITEECEILKTIDEKISAQYSHPTWMIEKIQQDWPDHWKKILLANNSRPPMSLRVNQYLTSRNEFQEKLKQNQIDFNLLPNLKNGIQLAKPIPVDKIPEFAEGTCSVQDGSGQKVVEFLDLKPKHSVLDACAAPGSKTTHIIETIPDIAHFVVIDKDANRLTKVKENIQRLQLPHEKLHFVLAEASHTKQWWDGVAFDRILLDAPCTASGTIRRHPDIKILRKPEDIQSLSSQQSHLLNALWPLLKKNGKLLYTTCSIFRDENEKVISQFLRQHKDAKCTSLDSDWGIELKHGRQLLPGDNDMDGFYYALLEKK